jgi:DNA polymerase-3 subunit chi
MTRVEFFFNVPDKLAKSAQLCGEALAQGHQLTIFSRDAAMSQALQQLLWRHSATSFLANAQSSDVISQFSPIVLDTKGDHLQQDDILINLQMQHPPFFSRFRCLIELVGLDEADKVAARLRYRFYRDRGYAVKSTDIAAPN